jgi:endonuclease/exonuclease/phosphatase family metal-dependent hydrolase
MKILQWNVWYKEDIANILNTIKEIDPDVVTLQELTINHPTYNQGLNTAEYIAKGLGFNYFFQAAQRSNTEGPPNILGNGIFSRYPILESDFTFIQEPPDPSFQTIDYSKEGRVYVEVTLDVDGKPVTVGTVHMSYTHGFVMTPAKEFETDKLLETIKDKKNCYILTGDFNAPPDSSLIKELQRTLINVGPPFEQATWTTKPFSYNGFETKGLEWRLDYCFGTPDIVATSAEIVETEYSDHLPVLVEC